VITLKEALKLSPEEIINFRQDLAKKIKEKKELGAYVEQLTDTDINEYGTGIPIAIKDNIQVEGWNVTCSSNILQGYVAPYNATVIDKMLENNLAPFGRCNMDEFAMGSSTETSWYGKTLNPHNPDCVPGGSSGGSAAAVGAGLAIAALGSDTGGSIRQPAAFCGCVGMKPTYGKVSRYGLSAYSSSLDQIGPITQNVEDAAILYDIIAGHESKDSTSVDTPHIKVCDKLALEDAGHKIIYKNMINSKYDIAAYYIVAAAEASANFSRYDGVRYGNRARILLGTFVLSSGYYDAYYIKAQKARHLIKEQFEKIFEEADLIFTPVAPTPAFEFGSKKDPLEMYLSDIYTIAINLAGLPAISVPIGKSSNDLPIGGQFIAKAFDEQTLFDGALSLERILA